MINIILINRARQHFGLSQKELATVSRVPLALIEKLELGQGTETISIHDLCAIADALCFDVRDLMKGPEGLPENNAIAKLLLVLIGDLE